MSTINDAENTIAFMGIEGTNGDLACRQKHPYMHTLPCASFEDAFKAVEEGRAKFAMIPIENSQAGRVAEIHNILPRTKLHIIGEHVLEVHHCLLAPEGATLESIKDVYSHPQALMQCRQYILDKGWEPRDHASTATAARDVSQWKDTSKAALASSLAGELYGLKRLAENVEDADNNKTLFIAVAREPLDPEPETPGRVLTSLLITLRNIPAALYKALGGFATNGINMTKLESYIRGDDKLAQFFITFEGNPHERRVQLALEELSFYCQKVQVLGVYMADDSPTQ